MFTFGVEFLQVRQRALSVLEITFSNFNKSGITALPLDNSDNIKMWDAEIIYVFIHASILFFFSLFLSVVMLC